MIDDENNIQDLPDIAELGEISELVPESENSNPAIALDEMLSEAIAHIPAVTESVEIHSVPTFQVQVKKEDREVFQKALSTIGVSSDSLVASRLSEYQAIRLFQELRRLGGSATVELVRPDIVSSEEDLALGDLFSATESDLPQVDGAPAVILPKNEKGVVLFTGDTLPGFTLIQTLGVATAHRSIARRLFHEADVQLAKELQRYSSAPTSLPKNRVELLFQDLFLDLQKCALSQGGNAVLAVKIESFPDASHRDPDLEQMRLVAIGTAAVVDKCE